jgi:hypothetical protein
MYPVEYQRGSLIIKEGDVGSIVYVMEGESRAYLNVRAHSVAYSARKRIPSLWPKVSWHVGEN